MADFGDSDVLEWELKQVSLLQQLSPVYGEGWEVGGKWYNKRLKLIQAQSAARQKALISNQRPRRAIQRAGSSQQPYERLPAPLGWEDKSNQRKDGQPFKDFKDAMNSLIGTAPYAQWKIDRDAPSGLGWRRYISISTSNPPKYARRRLVKVKGLA